MNRLCKFACKYGYCPGEICVTQQAEEPEVDVVSVDNPDYYKKEQGEVANAFNCMIQKDPDPNYDGALQCYNVCKDVVDAAKGKCSCDKMLVNVLAETVLEAMPKIAQIGCYMVMSTLKTVLDVGLNFIPGVGKAISAGLNMVTTAAQTAAYLYDKDNDPGGAFEWWSDESNRGKCRGNMG
ncbi:chitinase [Apiospora arundinis]|uniref:Chitinase n=1 Tax=Apiospora arundinis TaxID=335852 RepID=A0ABR2HK77_9PEZI